MVKSLSMYVVNGSSCCKNLSPLIDGVVFDDAKPEVFKYFSEIE